jgi:4'-phosphopantetheinyl transferase
MIRWLVQSIVDHPDLAAGRPPAGLLSRAEQERYAGYLNPKRRRDWLSGRWTAKKLIQAHYAATAGLEPALDSFTITQEPDGAPYAISCDPTLVGARSAESSPVRLPLVLSISHSHGYALCAVCAGGEPAPKLGADIELVERRDPAFAHDFFTAREQAAFAAVPARLADLMITATWSAKESVLKALRLGLRVDTRTVECFVTPAEPHVWTPFCIELCPALGQKVPQAEPLASFAGWWRIMDNRLRPGTQFVLTLVARHCSL